MKYEKILRYFSVKELEFIKTFPDELKAMAIVGRVYAEGKDLCGNSITYHFKDVSDHATTIDAKTVGWLHDVVEDGYIDLGDLLLLGFSIFVVNTIRLLSRDKRKYPKYEDYITSIIESGNPVAIEIKFLDMTNNMSPKRLFYLKDARQDRAIKKYVHEWLRVAKVYEEIKTKELQRKRNRT